MLQNVINSFKFRLEKCIDANSGTSEQNFTMMLSYFMNMRLLLLCGNFVFSSFSCSTTTFRIFCVIKNTIGEQKG
jgi:hypothetical protein